MATDTSVRADEPICLDTEGDVQIDPQSLLTGRTFISGKSGSGKSNTANVVAEQLLERGHSLLIIDMDGEYHTLKERYEMLHVGASDDCDIKVGPEHGERLAEIALLEGVPIVLDLSGYIEDDVADELIYEVVRHLFYREQDLKKPFLIIAEEAHEYLPQQGGSTPASDTLVKVGKRGRKRGLGLCAISQRPADVDKSFITQADHLIWHRLTWDNDTRVVSKVVGSTAADAIEDFDDGEAFIQADQLDAEVLRTTIRRMETFDGGATPELGGTTQPDVKSVSEELLDELTEISDREQHRQSRIEELESELEEKQDRIDELEERVQTALDFRQMVESAEGLGVAPGKATDGTEGFGAEKVTLEVDGAEFTVPEIIQTEVIEVREQNEKLSNHVEELLTERDELASRVDDLEAELAKKQDRLSELEQLEGNRNAVKSAVAELSSAFDLDTDSDEVTQDRLSELERANEELRKQNEALQEELEEGQTTPTGDGQDEILEHPAIETTLSRIATEGRYADKHYERVIRILKESDDPLTASEVAPLVEVSTDTIREVLSDLAGSALVSATGTRPAKYELDHSGIDTLRKVSA